ncbi:MAG: hypothetical protein HY207_12790 [Nitrospirae bacterium]|nr:hypothetical protein [Nitrospirota bacterium]
MIKRLIKRVVVTGVGEGPGKAVVAPFKRHGWLVVGVDTAFQPEYVHQFYLVSQPTHPSWIEELRILVSRERSTLVVPTRRDEFLPLARRRGEFLRLGANVYLPRPEVVEYVLDSHLWSRRLGRAGVGTASPWSGGHGEGREVRCFEVSLCRDDRAEHALLGCSVHELSEEGGAASFRAERRKDETEVEALAAQTAESLELAGLATIHICQRSDGCLTVTGVTLSPCVYGPFTDDVFEALTVLWKRDHPA